MTPPYTDNAALVVPPPPLPAPGAQAAAPGGGGSGSVVSVNGALVDVARLQANLAASEAERRGLAMGVQRMGVQLSAQQRREAALLERVAALAAEVATLGLRLNHTTAGRATVDGAFEAVLADVEAAQAQLASAASRLKDFGVGAGAAAAAPAAAAPMAVEAPEVAMGEAAGEASGAPAASVKAEAAE
ncbi:hypothetical protein TSOC_002311 [Tetrabaena socialis]|uniref:Uncharacterized protein n=1 Tax=Tetrabaena socialis TaxID=47790 RepID=A0A2J8AEG0_9CHLO|nr:hypothetical protein TSOC_002311 [Tetrabaena socialis]|eukprot:PNH10907.1 hypothetical protein TSOC_002311 [Tetrabaena socialis]